MERLDILAIGAHPDDVELGVGGMLASASRTGYKTGIIDLTRGEMGSRGTVRQRDKEAVKAANILNVVWRKNLNIPDRSIEVTKENIEQLVKIIRTVRPNIILAPYWKDRHPDHIKASQLVQEAYFDAGLAKVCSELAPYRPAIMAYYCLNKDVSPMVIIDVSLFYDIKMKAVSAHTSQFANQSKGILTHIKNRDCYYGSLIGVDYGEGLVFNTPLAMNDISLLWRAKE